ncbi:uncharacterized protein BX664DRAFT_326752 [Halteromyces radiatus]|uniref:uncharacterized protein n=1 Tax=Halteromyces radiatus TaxID=101107 RepID=UPI00221EACFE|nr:uncharacterized protein BX664DRAFT_326752 [Halteromyces radiatus]KAI8097590.1 hypothetical protein BX664DRAFT_326752 [Halteromyces radiatus]
MCRRITCKTCNKYTWTGCGLHIQSALAGLTENEICQCNAKETTPSDKQNEDDNGIFSKIKSAIGM